VSLSGVGSFAGPNGTATYNFGVLGAGTYTLSVFSSVTGIPLGLQNVGYSGLLGLTASATKVPEPGTLALLGLGLIGVAAAARRKAKQN